MNLKPTRGSGILEGFLAKKRAEIARRFIPVELKSGRILDIGCGEFPYFLDSIEFGEKYAIDRVDISLNPGVKFVKYDIREKLILPFEDNFFEVVTMLAVIEHIEFEKREMICKEVYRILKKGGRFILTTPNRWTDKLLKIMAVLNLVSEEEITEHKDLLSKKEILNLLKKAGFREDKIFAGYFEFGANLWAVGDKV